MFQHRNNDGRWRRVVARRLRKRKRLAAQSAQRSANDPPVRPAPSSPRSDPDPSPVASGVEWSERSREEIRAELDSRGIDYNPRWRTPKLIELLEVSGDGHSG